MALKPDNRDSPHRMKQPIPALPEWFRITFVIMALVQWVLVIDMLPRFFPDGWYSVFAVPIGIFRVIGLSIAVLLSVFAGGVFFSPRSRWLTALFGLLQSIRERPVSIILPLICLAFPLVYFSNADWLGYSLLSIQFMLIAVLLYLGGRAVWHRKNTGWLLISVIIIIMGLALRLWLLAADYVWIDEGIYLSATASMVNGGSVAPIMFHLPEDIPIRPPWGYSVALYGLWGKLFGVNLLSARSLSYLLGAFTLPFIYGSVKIWYGKQAALVSTGVSALSVLFLLTTNARNDAFPMLIVSIALFTHLYAVHKQINWLHAAAGLLTGLSLEGHITNAVFIAAFAGYYLVKYIEGSLKTGHWIRNDPLWGFGAGLAVASFIYIVLHILILPSPSRFFTAVAGALPVENRWLFRLTTTGTRCAAYWENSPFEVILVGAGIIAALFRRSASDRHWLILVFFSQIGYFFLAPPGSIHYLTYSMPLLLVSAGVLFDVLSAGEENFNAPAAELAYTGLVVVLASTAINLILQHRQDRIYWLNERQPIISTIRENLTPSQAIIAPSVYYAYLPEYRNFLLVNTADIYVGPALTGMDLDAYWLQVLLKTWPAAKIDSVYFEEAPVYDTYMQALHAREASPGLWLVENPDSLVVVEDQRLETSALTLVTYRWLTDQPDASPVLHTIWITKTSSQTDCYIERAAHDDQGNMLYEDTMMIISGWAKQPTSGWEPYQFHDVMLTWQAPVPSGKIHSLTITLVGPPGQPGKESCTAAQTLTVPFPDVR